MVFSLANQYCIQNELAGPENIATWYVFLSYVRFPEKEVTQQKSFYTFMKFQ